VRFLGTAVYGLDRWRAETTGKLRIELAEGALADFYEARDVIQAARSPVTGPGEGSTRREREPGETAAQTLRFDSFYTVAERLQNKSEFFAKMSARRYRFMAHFGPDSVKPYEDLRRIYDEIIGAPRFMRPGTRGGLGDHAFYQKQPEDPILKRLDAVVAQIEQICRPIIQEGVRGTRN
jgi:hypothetical protein